jgi:hypothetical protein
VIISSGYDLGGSFLGALIIHDSTSGAELYAFTTTGTTGFPKHGTSNGRTRYHNGHVYFGITYNSDVAYQNQRGLCDINLATSAITTHRPTWSSDDDYYLRGYFVVDTDNNRLWITTKSEIVSGEYVTAARFDISTGAWTPYTHRTFSGIPATYSPSVGQSIFYDATTGNIGVGLGIDSGNRGCIMFNTSSDFNQIKYLTASYAAGWIWDVHGDIAAMTLSTASSDPSAIVDTDDVLWLVWDNFNFSDALYTPYWDRDMGAYSLVDYLVGALNIKWEVKKPNAIDFSLSQGHLFDPQNSYSLLRDIVKKGRLLNVSLGEYLEGTAYLENQGKFIVTETRLKYGRDQYPTISIRGESLSSIWKDQKVISTQLYNGTSLAAIEDVLESHAQLTDADHDIPVFANDHAIEHQFVDETVWDIIEAFCDHWFYVPYDDMDGIFTCVRIDFDKSVDHTYSGLTQIAEFSPDDSYSDFTNAVRVSGESDDTTDRLYDEELIDVMAGSIGWWEKNSTHTLRYGKEGKTRKCRNPRIHVIQSAKLVGFIANKLAIGSGGESITYIDPNETYCEITIDIPDLTASVVASILAVATSGTLAIGCDGWLTGWCGVCILALSVAVAFAMYFLAAVANYQYEIYARPFGRERQQIQYLASDSTFQQELGGRVVQKDIDDPFCNTVYECQRVAESNLLLIQAQRNRVQFKKVAHMQDEIGDKIQVTHPYSEETLDVLITRITRTYKKGSDGGMWDAIEGWRIP